MNAPSPDEMLHGQGVKIGLAYRCTAPYIGPGGGLIPSYTAGYLVDATRANDAYLLHFPGYGEVWVDADAATRCKVNDLLPATAPQTLRQLTLEGLE